MHFHLEKLVYYQKLDGDWVTNYRVFEQPIRPLGDRGFGGNNSKKRKKRKNRKNKSRKQMIT